MIQRQTLQRFSMSMLLMAMCLAGATFHIKYQVRDRQQDLRRLKHQLTETTEALQVMKAEWEHLNHPKRLQALNERHLGLKPIEIAKLSSFDDFEKNRRQDVQIVLAKLNKEKL